MATRYTAKKSAPKSSKLEKEFAALWKYYKGPELTRELEFYPGRKWRADFAHKGSRVLIEIEGAVWTNGRHTRGSGFIADAEKYNSATLHGWRVFRLADKLICREWIQNLIEFINDETPTA